MKKKIYLTLVFVLLFSSIINSQTPIPGAAPTPPPPGLPIDGGMVFLLVSGLVYGINKLKE